MSKSATESIELLMDSLDSLVYVSDLETYELLYINEFGRKIWGENTTGKKCWEVLQTGQTEPCDFCTNDKLLDDSGKPKGVYLWDFQNTVDQQWYECRDQVIKWPDGRLVRMEIATNITEQKEAREQLMDLTEQLQEANASLTTEMKKRQEAEERIKILNGLLPICAYCKKIRNPDGSWESMECYIQNHSEAHFSHSLCPNCESKF